MNTDQIKIVSSQLSEHLRTNYGLNIQLFNRFSGRNHNGGPEIILEGVSHEFNYDGRRLYISCDSRGIVESVIPTIFYIP